MDPKIVNSARYKCFPNGRFRVGIHLNNLAFTLQASPGKLDIRLRAYWQTNFGGMRIFLAESELLHFGTLHVRIEKW